MTARHWKLVGGGEATVLDVNGEQVAVESTRPSPPGSTFEGQSDGAGPFFVKVRACKRCKENPERFRIEGRLVNLTRVQREALQGF
jgi:hypothetical protein